MREGRGGEAEELEDSVFQAHLSWKERIVAIKVSLVAQSCLTLCNPMDCSPPGSVHAISQARVLEWVANSFSRGSLRPRDQTHISCIGRQILYH